MRGTRPRLRRRLTDGEDIHPHGRLNAKPCATASTRKVQRHVGESWHPAGSGLDTDFRRHDNCYLMFRCISGPPFRHSEWVEIPERRSVQ